MTNPTQEIPAEEMERIKKKAKSDSIHALKSIEDRFTGYIEGAKAEYLRTRQIPAILEWEDGIPLIPENLKKRAQDLRRRWIALDGRFPTWEMGAEWMYAAILMEQNKTTQQAQGETITESVVYPVGGYAPGNYYGKCTSCGKEFRGDKRAFQCEPCGKTDEKLQGYMITVLGFIAEKYSLPNGGQSLLDEYKKHIYDTFIKEYRNGK